MFTVLGLGVGVQGSFMAPVKESSAFVLEKHRDCRKVLVCPGP